MKMTWVVTIQHTEDLQDITVTRGARELVAGAIKAEHEGLSRLRRTIHGSNHVDLADIFMSVVHHCSRYTTVVAV